MEILLDYLRAGDFKNVSVEGGPGSALLAVELRRALPDMHVSLGNTNVLRDCVVLTDGAACPTKLGRGVPIVRFD